MTYLVHHGIKGQMWGFRNGPPYPLGAGAKSAKEKKAERSEKKKHTARSSGENIARRIISKNGDKKVGFAAELAIYTAIQLAPLLAYLGIAVAFKHSEKKDKEKEDKEAEKRFEKRNPKRVSELPKLESPMEPSESMKLTNPGFPEEGHVYNCTFCTTAMALREKGYDVKAQTTDHGWYTNRFWERTFGIEKQTPIHELRPNDIVNTLESQGKGAYGNVSVYWKWGGGHSIFWKNDDSGKLHIYDGQAGEEYDTSENSKLMKALSVGETTYCRLDNVEPTDYVLAFVEPRETVEEER